VAALLALLSSLLWGASDFLGGTATRRLPGTTVVVLSQAVALAVLVPIVLAVDAGPVGPVLAPSVAAGVVGPLALVAFYRALALGTMGVVAPIAALGVAVPVVAGLTAGESPTSAQLVGIAVASVGVALACGPELDGAGRGGALPLVLALVAALGFGTVFVLLAEGAGQDGAGVGTVLLVLLVMRGTSVLLLSTFLLVRSQVTRAQATAGTAQVARAGGASLVPPSGEEPSSAARWRAALPVLVVMGLFDVAANGTYATATQTGLVSVAAVLASLYPVVTALLAWRVHDERLARVQWIGVVLAMTGVVLLAGG
jgi:drug/metabolite transporter (DMT)-like permease